MNKRIRRKLLICDGPHEWGDWVLSDRTFLPIKKCNKCKETLSRAKFYEENRQKKELIRLIRSKTDHIDLFW